MKKAPLILADLGSNCRKTACEQLLKPPSTACAVVKNKVAHRLHRTWTHLGMQWSFDHRRKMLLWDRYPCASEHVERGTARRSMRSWNRTKQADAVCDGRSLPEFVRALVADREDEVAREAQAPSSSYGPGANGWENSTIETSSLRQVPGPNLRVLASRRAWEAIRGVSLLHSCTAERSTNSRTEEHRYAPRSNAGRTYADRRAAPFRTVTYRKRGMRVP